MKVKFKIIYYFILIQIQKIINSTVKIYLSFTVWRRKRINKKLIYLQEELEELSIKNKP